MSVEPVCTNAMGNKELTQDDLRKVIEQGDEQRELDEVISDLVGKYGMDRGDARVKVLTTTQQEFKDGNTYLTFDDSADFEEFTVDAQGVDLESDDGGVTPDETGMGESSPETAEWEGSSETFNADEVDRETPPATENEFYYLPVREESDHPLVPEDRDYLYSERAEGVNDVEEFTFAMNNNDFGTLITGEPGTGKGHMVKHTAAKTNTPLIRVNMGVGITKKKLVGGFVPRANGEGLEKEMRKAEELSDKHGIPVGKALETLNVREKFRWKDGLFTMAFKNGWWLLLDEINAADAETLMPLFGALEDKESRSLELTERSQKITPHPGFRLVATRNPKHHAGTKSMNHALLDRMFEIEQDYLDEQSETKLIESSTELNHKEATKVVNLAQSIRAAYPENVSRTLTPRGLKRIGKWAEIYSLEQAARKELTEGLDYEDEKDALERKIESVF